MVEQESPYQLITAAQPKAKAEPKYPWVNQWWFILLAALFTFQTITPMLQWPIGLPRTIILTVEIFSALAAFFAFAIMLTKDRIPKGVLVILGITLVWGIVAFYEGQSVAAFLWGWWRFFLPPLLCIFTYLAIGNPKNFAEWFLKFCVALLVFQVIVQLIMVGLGYPTGDNLAGTFGRNGVMHLTMVIFFAVCMGIGHWIATGQIKYMLVLLTLGAVGSILDGTKFYVFAIIALLVVAAVINMIQGGRIRRLFVFTGVMILVLAVLFPTFDGMLEESGTTSLTGLLDPDTLIDYLMYTNVGNDGRSYVGRGYAPILAWQQLQRDVTTTLFGFGLGSRSTSSQLGLAGAAFQDDPYGMVNGSTLAQLMLEFGVIGMMVFLLIIIWINMYLFRYLRKRPEPYKASMTYGLILFTSFWPVWIWYHNVAAAAATLTLYWVTLGYILYQLMGRSRRSKLPHRA